MNPAWFAGRLRELRVRADLTQQSLAEAAGLKVGGIRDLEQGRRSPAWETVIALCKALRVTCESLAREPGDLPAPAPGRPRKLPVVEVAEKPAKRKAKRKKAK